MTRTRRMYNKKAVNGFFHPFHQVCMGHCPMCKRHFVSDVRKRDRTYAELLRSELLGAEEERMNPDVPQTLSDADDYYDAVMREVYQEWDERWGSHATDASCLSTEPTLC